MNRIFTVTLVRHGETLSNRDNIMQGQLDTQLSDLGQRQAQLLGLHLQDFKFTHMFTSDLTRAADTAKAIAQANRQSHCSLKTDKRLRERGFGWLEGKPLSEFREAMAKSKHSSHSFTPEGGETMEQVTARVISFLDDLFKLMAEPLMNNSECTAEDGFLAQVQNPVSSHASMITSVNVPLTIEVPNINLENSHEENPSNHHVIDLQPHHKNGHPASPPSQANSHSPARSSYSSDQDNANIDSASVLIVSHGLCLRELSRLLLDRFKGKLEGRNAQEVSRISPNTGVSRLIMSVSRSSSRVCAKCIECVVLNDTTHLEKSQHNLVSHAKFQGAL
ncbi:fructose-2,6-bisphosphatase TIGAR-like isoform X2 [Physella acuta]|uniref:fructose-2,6-bisphosphatase TIGAR-like isoform X2 n=1 Tax=Physella acuta TaxID=109671 RepID=UPI0027DB6FB5|nr:fructose-2,6-bisphosphatase TIGAR-like isoform X2 [Physella acuta]